MTRPAPRWCSNDAGLGCHNDGIVYAGQFSIDHELVHAVVATLGDPAAFWSEGLAEALQSHRTIFDWSAPIANLDLDAPQLSYLTAGHFSRWLLETYGLESYRAEAVYFDQAPHSYGALIACDHADLPRAWPLCVVDIRRDRPDLAKRSAWTITPPARASMAAGSTRAATTSARIEAQR